jgi:hypothetical protein
MADRTLHGCQRMLKYLAIERRGDARQAVEQGSWRGLRRQPGRCQQAKSKQAEAEPAE